MKKNLFILIIITIGLVFAGKQFFFKDIPKGKDMKISTPAVMIAQVTEIEVIDKIETTGRVVAVDDVNITARVYGYLKKVYFKEGSFVEKGDLLYLIEPDEYQIAVQQAKADIEEAKAALFETEKNLVRISELVKQDFASKSQYDDAFAKRNRANAVVDVKHAVLEQAKFNLKYTKIYAPVNGKIGKEIITQGNFVSPSSGALTRIVSLNPICIKFSLGIKDYLKLIKSNEDSAKRIVEIELPDNTLYPVKGEILFYDNTIDSATGTIEVVAIFKNPDYMLIPGQYVNVVTYANKARKVVAIPQEAVLANPEGKYVYVLQKNDIVKTKSIKVEKQYKNYWIVTEGLNPGEKIVVKGIQKIHPDMKVKIISEKSVEN